ncbi:hypothetical protein [Streptomonospora alba]|uniref:hypothetical protein n=1 Tax=Streptomonospora alba TaxID=183763 RepID=UPI0012ECF019|nr:hypothetical protein [Streptomonospora alba]
MTWPVEHRVLAMVQSWQGGDRLADIVPPVIEADPAVQLMYTAVENDSQFSASGADYLRRLDGLVLPWERARAYRYDLAIAAHTGELEQVRAPVLVVPHGVGMSKLVPRRPGYGPPARRPVGGAVAGALVRYGRVAPAVMGLAHERQRAIVAREVPEAAGVCRVVGDPCYDRMLASAPLRSAYRRALGVGEHQRLLVLSSTWGRTGLAGRCPELLTRLPAELSGDHVIAAVLHPAVWSAHGRRQVAAWLAEARRAGLRLLAPDASWQAALVAADAVIGDNGAVTCYGAALNRPTLLAAGDLTDVVPGSQVAELYRRARPLDPRGGVRGQIERAVDRHDPAHGSAIAGLLTSAPGRSAELLRVCVYELMDRTEPSHPPAVHHLPVPDVLDYGPAAAHGPGGAEAERRAA